MQKFRITFVTVNFRTGEVQPEQSKIMEHVNCLSMLGKLAILSGQLLYDHNRYNLVSIRIEPVLS